VQEALRRHGSTAQVVEWPSGTRTVAEAAASIGCDPGQIAKSLVFMCDDEPILIVMSGRYRVDVKKVQKLLGGPVRQAKAAEVKEITGFPIGGVSPVGGLRSLRTLLDAHLWDYPVVYAAAGTPSTAFATTGSELLALTGGEKVEVAE
jgi:prolyl-tRNA editing enzyme YbaK/EbsC (Cys-tRNA(Pro) deacylase)